jgi:hypothetical protein
MQAVRQPDMAINTETNMFKDAEAVGDGESSRLGERVGSSSTPAVILAFVDDSKVQCLIG